MFGCLFGIIIRSVFSLLQLNNTDEYKVIYKKAMSLWYYYRPEEYFIELIIIVQMRRKIFRSTTVTNKILYYFSCFCYVIVGSTAIINTLKDMLLEEGVFFVDLVRFGRFRL